MTAAPGSPNLPDGWSARAPEPDDVDALVRLHVDALAAAGRPAPGDLAHEAARIEELVAGASSWTRRQLVASPVGEAPAAWATVHDRAAGRTIVGVEVAGPDRISEPVADEVAAAMLAWAAQAASGIARLRGLDAAQLDASAHSADARLHRWLARAGYRHVRTWLQMARLVTADDAPAPAPRAGVTVRRVRTSATGIPVAADLQAVHLVLERSFADHFNSYRESFPEFIARLREDPGHRWDHWWLAEATMEDGSVLPGGALVASAMPADASGARGTYVEYIGVHRRARGRGVAKALLAAVLADAADRGIPQVALEVDRDSPTGADGLYRALGWATAYETQSWHAQLVVEADDHDSDR
ncbi:GNAT family N-acetyltransferase [Agrococcus versicolor]|uniref:GNAT family N-acetyltransferase n=1 Tax=Agrococcus versicolor TaxID=501482 RepID=A0ABP5MFX5_9MICO